MPSQLGRRISREDIEAVQTSLRDFGRAEIQPGAEAAGLLSLRRFATAPSARNDAIMIGAENRGGRAWRGGARH